MICSACKGMPSKVLYAGLPMYLCDCGEVSGFFSLLLFMLPFNGIFMPYEGSYIKALYNWLRDKDV